MAEKSNQPRDISQIIRYLTNTFNMATSSLDRAVWATPKGANELYILQTEFAYLLHEVMLGPICVMQKNISACNEYIDQTIQQISKGNTK